MATSETTTFNRTRDQIILKALSFIGVRTANRYPSAFEMSESSDTLNMMVKSWKAKGQYLWKTKEGTLFLTPNQNQYILDGATANAAEIFSETETSAAAIAGASTIAVVSTAGFADGNFIGVELENNTLFWTTISSSAGLIITLAEVLPNAVAKGAIVFVYETKIARPESITESRLRFSGSQTDVVVSKIPRKVYYDIPNKFAQGKPNQFFYDKQLSSGSIFLYPTPNTCTDTLKFTYTTQFFDFVTAIDDPDFPSEWLLPLSLNLASLLTLTFGTSKEKADDIILPVFVFFK